jgi:hypothetical protein
MNVKLFSVYVWAVCERWGGRHGCAISHLPVKFWFGKTALIVLQAWVGAIGYVAPPPPPPPVYIDMSLYKIQHHNNEGDYVKGSSPHNGRCLFRVYFGNPKTHI